MRKIFFSLIILIYAPLVYSQLPGRVYDFMFNSITKYTPKGELFTAKVLISTYELTQPEKNSAAAYMLSYYNNRITLLSEATRSYNCHGYAWYISEGGDNVWINTPNDDKFWNGNSYTQISWQENAKIAFSEVADHSAIATDHQDTMISKWGQYPLFKHHINDCDYTPKTNLKYYKLSKPSISGNFSAICNNSQRTFSSDISDTNFDYDWNVTSNLNEVSGDGTNTYTVGGTSNIGYSTIFLTVTTPSGATVSTHKYIGVNTPYPENLSFSLYTSGGTPVSFMCPNTHYHVYLTNNDGCSLSNYSWSVPSAWTVNYTWGDMISVYTNSSPGGMIEVYATTCCGIYTKVKIGYLPSGYCGGYYSMILSPNPAVGETTVTIESISKDVVVDENKEWEIEVFSETQVLKMKNTKLKGKSAKLQTSGWKQGVYFVRVRYAGEVLQGKLLVK